MDHPDFTELKLYGKVHGSTRVEDQLHNVLKEVLVELHISWYQFSKGVVPSKTAQTDENMHAREPLYSNSAVIVW